MKVKGSAFDPLEIMNDEIQKFTQDLYKGTRKALAETVTRPADPAARKLTPAEEEADDMALLADPMLVLGEADELSARYGLAPHLTPKELWQRIERAARRAG